MGKAYPTISRACSQVINPTSLRWVLPWRRSSGGQTNGSEERSVPNDCGSGVLWGCRGVLLPLASINMRISSSFSASIARLNPRGYPFLLWLRR